MEQKDTVITFKKPDTNYDLLTEVLRKGARQLLASAIEAEGKEFLQQNNPPETRARFIRNGYLPEREIQTGIGGVAVEVPRIREVRAPSSSKGRQISIMMTPIIVRY